MWAWLPYLGQLDRDDPRNELCRDPKPPGSLQAQYWESFLAPAQSWTQSWLLFGRALLCLDQSSSDAKSSSDANRLAAWWSYSAHDQVLKSPSLPQVYGKMEGNRIWATQSTPSNSRLGNSSWPSITKPTTAFWEANPGWKRKKKEYFWPQRSFLTVLTLIGSFLTLEDHRQ